MPLIKDLERFTRDLVALSRENEVLAQWGETREDPPLPEEGAAPPPPRARQAKAEVEAAEDFGSDAELAALLGGPADDESTEALTEATPEEDANFDSFLSSLGAIPDEAAAEEPSVEEAADEDGDGVDELADFDLGALAGAMEEDALDEAAAPLGDEAPLEAPSPAADLPDETFAEPVGDLPADLDWDLPAEAAEAPTEAAPDTLPADAQFDELPDFDIDAEPEAEAAAFADESAEAAPDAEAEALEEAPAEAAGDAATESSSLDEFSMPDFGDFELPSEEAPAEDQGVPADEAAPGAEAQGDLEELSDLGVEDAQEDLGTEVPELADEDFSAPGPADAPAASPLDGIPEGMDAFDSFSFDEPGATGLAGEALDKELANLGDSADTAPTFNIEGAWGGFGTEAEEAPPPPPPRSAEPRPAAKRQEPATRKLALSEAQVDRLQDNLLALPLNLRVAVEDIVANEKGGEGQRTDLVWMLVENAKAAEIASAAGKILKRRIAIPEGFALRTGATWLSEKGSFRYLLVHTILPITRTIVLVLMLAGALGYLGYKFIYRPLAATALYRTGYQRIQESRFPEAEEAFAKATEIREFVVWYYRYAEAYVAKRRFIDAEKKYAALLKAHPKESAAALALARLQRDQLKYRDATKTLDTYILDSKPLDKDALLLEGDIFLEWAEEDPARFEDARRRYAILISTYGAGDLYLERMLAYFMRVDKLKEVLPLKDRFLAMKTNPLSASTMAELGGYLLDKKEMTDVFSVLKEALAKDRLLPETHYQLFRYYRKAGDAGEETKALDNSIAGFRRLAALGKRRLSMYLEALVRRGDLRLEGRQFLAAEEDYGAAAVAYEEALALDRLKRTAAFGKAYAGLGDVAYWGKDDLDSALSYFERAAEHGWDNPGIRYKRGFVDYRRGRYAEALEQFYRSGQDGNESPWLLYALGNSFIARSDWHAAEGYFRRLVDSLGDRLAAMDWPVPQEKASDRALVEVLMESQNNLGVALYRLGNRTGNARLKASAMAAFTESARLFDFLVHDARSLIGANQANLGYLNMDYALHPRRGIDLASYAPISKDEKWPAP